MEISNSPVDVAEQRLDTQTHAIDAIDQPLDALQPSGFSTGQPSESQVDGIPLGPLEFAIPLSMDSRVKDDYDTTLASEKKNIARFLRAFPPGSSGGGVVDSEVGVSFHPIWVSEGNLMSIQVNAIVLKMEQMVEQLNNITTHPDLNLANHITGETTDVAREASWAEYSSSKFQFLGYFIDAAVNCDLHVIIMAKEGKTVKLVEKYLLGKGFVYPPLRPDVTDKAELVVTKGSLSIGIRSTNEERTLEPPKELALIFALDNSFDGNDLSVQHLRAASSQGNGLVPVIHLIVTNTTEHIEWCLPKSSDINRLRLLVHSARTLGGSAGELPDNALGVQENAEEVLLYLTTDRASRTWPLAPVEALELDDITEVVPNIESEQLRSMSLSRQKRWMVSEVTHDSRLYRVRL
jgi:hypothetical protein